MSCPYNSMINCNVKDPKPCHKCGWNPAEDKRRKERIRYYLINPQLKKLWHVQSRRSPDL